MIAVLLSPMYSLHCQAKIKKPYKMTVIEQRLYELEVECEGLYLACMSAHQRINDLEEKLSTKKALPATYPFSKKQEGK